MILPSLFSSPNKEKWKMKKEIVATGPQQHNLWRGLFNFDLVSKKNSRFSSSLTYLFFFQDTYFSFSFCLTILFPVLLLYYYLLCSLPGSAEWLDKRHGYLFAVAFSYTFFRRWFQWRCSCRRTCWSISGVFHWF